MAFKIQTHKEVTQVTTIEDVTLGIMKWGQNNSFPQTLINLIRQSPCASPAVSRTAKFYKGSGFEGENQIVSPQGITLKKVVSIMAEDYATFEAFALHANYNIKGEVTTITPLRIAELRFNEFDELNFASKIGYFYNFGMNSEIQKRIAANVTKSKIKWINRFNPEAVNDQIDELKNGIKDYQGQVLYHSESGHSSYPIPPLQAAINYVLSDIENSILVRKGTSTGFVNSYLLKTTMDPEDPNLIALEQSIEDVQGARGTGGVVTMSGLSVEEVSATVLEEIGGGKGSTSSQIDNCTKSFELNQKVINGTYLIPPILSGADQKTGFSSADLTDAYFVFNATTQGGRDTIEAELNKLLGISVFPIKAISINKLTLDIDEEIEAAPAEGIPTVEEALTTEATPAKKTTEIPN